MGIGKPWAAGDQPATIGRPMTTRTILLAQFGTRVGTRGEGRTAQKAVWKELTSLPEGGILAADLSGIEVLSGSFADEAIGEPVARLAAGELPGRYLVVRAPSADLVEDLGIKLAQRRLALLAVLAGGRWLLLGHLPPYLRETLDWVVARGETTSQDLAQGLGVTPRAAATRIAQLAELRLVHLVPQARPSGGVLYLSRSLVSVNWGS